MVDYKTKRRSPPRPAPEPIPDRANNIIQTVVKTRKR